MLWGPVRPRSVCVASRCVAVTQNFKFGISGNSARTSHFCKILLDLSTMLGDRRLKEGGLRAAGFLICLKISYIRYNFFDFQYFLLRFFLKSDLIMKRSNPGSFKDYINSRGNKKIPTIPIKSRIFQK